MVCVAGVTLGEQKKFLSLPEIESQLSNAQQLHFTRTDLSDCRIQVITLQREE